MKPVRIVLIIAFALPFVLTASAGPAAAFCEIREPPSPLPTQVNGTQVEIQLTEGFARVVIIKEFYNPSPIFKEGQVFFPLERGHELITDLRLKIGNVVFNSTAQDRGEALDSFLDALAKGQDAALVQYDPPRDVYWVAVTIPPFSARTTVTTLEMPLTKVDGYYRYHYRLSVDARDSKDYLRVRVRIATSAPLEHVGIHSHPDLPILQTGDRVALAFVNSTAEAELRNLEIHFRTAGTSLAQASDSDGEHRFVRLSVDAQDPAFAESLRPRPRAFLVLLDASGSMSLGSRWDFARAATLRLLGDLRAGESFGIAAFQGTTRATYRSSLEAWAPDRHGDVQAFLAGIAPRGSTSFTASFPVIERWARQAREQGQQPILFLITDGRPTRGILALDLENAFKRISYDHDMPVFGLTIRPRDHTDENLLRNLTHFNRGGFVAVGGLDLPDRIAEILAAVRVPVLDGVRASLPGAENVTLASGDPQVVWQGGEAIVIARIRGTPFDPLAVGLRWTDDGTARGLDAVHEGTEVLEDPLLKRQWILARVHALLEEIRAHGDPATIETLKAFATAHRVVTPFTSLLVLIPQLPNPGDADSAARAGDSLFEGLAPGGVALSSPGSARGFNLLSPLEQEARRSEALRRDLLNPLLVEREIDRIVFEGSPEYNSLELRRALVVFQGTYVRILDLDQQLVLVVDSLPEVVRIENGAGVTLTVFAIWSFLQVRRFARRVRDSGTP